VTSEQSNKAGGKIPFGSRTIPPDVCGIVEIASVTVCGTVPGMIVAEGLNDATEFGGRPEALRLTGTLKAPSRGEIISEIFAVCPAVIAGIEVGGATEKSVTEK
jgi:hypothetical protein